MFTEFVNKNNRVYITTGKICIIFKRHGDHGYYAEPS